MRSAGWGGSHTARLQTRREVRDYLDGYEWQESARNWGSTYDPEGFGYRWGICLHTMESRGMGHPGGHPYPPHTWYDPDSRRKVQTVILSRGAFALYQSPYGSEYTNRARMLQCELVGYAEEAGSWSDQKLWNIAEDVIVPFVRAVEEEGSSVDILMIPDIGVVPMSASEYAPQRMSEWAWRHFNGLLSHRNVPYNDHWDTGLLALHKIAAYALQILGRGGGYTPTPTRKVQRYVQRMDSVQPYIRRLQVGDKKGEIDVFQWKFVPEWEPQPCIAYDFPLLPVGAIVGVHRAYPDTGWYEDGNVEHTPTQLVNAEGVGAVQWTWWGTTAQHGPIKRAGFHTIVVPQGTPLLCEAILPMVVHEAVT